MEISKRTIETTVQKREFKVVVIDKPTQWEPAKAFKLAYEMPNPNGKGVIKFPLRGASLGEWEQIEINHSLPDQPEPEATEQEKSAYQSKRAAALDEKQIAVFELLLGKSIPAKTAEEKIAWLNDRNPGEIEALFAFIFNNACGFGPGSILEEYNQLSAQAIASPEVTEFKDFQDWTKAADSRYFFRFCRYKEDIIYEFPLRAISTDLKRKIEAETKEPDPPQVPGRNPKTRRFDPNIKAYNRKDPHWLRSVRAINQKQTAMYLEASLLFEIPGTNYQEKYNWLSQMLVGEVIGLKKYIEDEVIGYAGRYSFF